MSEIDLLVEIRDIITYAALSIMLALGFLAGK